MNADNGNINCNGNGNCIVGISASRLDRHEGGGAVTAVKRIGDQRQSAISGSQRSALGASLSPQLQFSPFSKQLQFFMPFMLLHVLHAQGS